MGSVWQRRDRSTRWRTRPSSRRGPGSPADEDWLTRSSSKHSDARSPRVFEFPSRQSGLVELQAFADAGHALVVLALQRGALLAFALGTDTSLAFDFSDSAIDPVEDLP